MSCRRAGVIGTCLALVATSAAADLPLWEAGLGLGAVQLPLYRGSDQSNRWLLPVPYVVYRGPILRADRNGARVLLVDSERIDVDISLGISPPINSDDSEARRDMPDLPASVEIGPKLNVALARGAGWHADFRLPLRAVVGLSSSPRTLGWTLAPVLNLDLESRGLNWGLQAGPLWGDRRLHAHLYDVAPAYATAVRPAYSAGGGFAGWQGTLALSRRTPDSWLGLFARFDSVAGAAFADSPLVRSRSNWSLGVAMSWILVRSDTRVERDD